MIIEKLEIVNFKSYRGTHILDLCVEPGKPLVIIKGDNGYGKTSILEAILWCLYGDAAFGGSSSQTYNRLNNDARDAGEPMEVRLTLDRNDETWNIVRRLHLCNGGDPLNSYDYSDDGPSVEIDGSIQTDAHDLIQSILPHNASQFFLFDGEEIKIYTKQAHHENVKKAILRVLNLPILTNAVYDLEQTADILESEELKELRKTGKHDRLLEDHQKVSDEIIRTKEDLDQNLKMLKQFETEADQKEAALAKAADKTAQIEQLTGLRQDLARQDEQLNLVNRDIDELKRRFPLILLTDHLKEAVETISQQKQTMMSVEISAAERKGEMKAIERLIKGGVCSGVPVAQNLRDCLTVELSKLEAHVDSEASSLRAETVVFEEQGRLLLGSAQTSGSGFEELMIHKARIKSEIRKIDKEKMSLEDEIGKSKESEITAATARYKVLTRELIPPLTAQVEPMQKKLRDLEERKRKLTSQIENAGKKQGDIKSLKALRDRATLASRALQASKDGLLSDLRAAVQDESSRVYRRMTNMPEVFNEVVVGENFELSLRAIDGKPFEGHKGSEGQKEVLAFAFMAGLAKVSGNDAPFVMDSAFIRFDKAHRKNILQFMPKLTKQVVLLVIPETELDDKAVRSVENFTSRVIELSYDQAARRTRIVSKEGL